MHPWLRLICQVTLVAYVYVCMYESMYNNREREELIEKIKKVVTGWDEVEGREECGMDSGLGMQK